MSPLKFKEIANRDAWHTIRGFVYQVNHTILRWVRLTESEALELERGEDIDTISKEIQNNAFRVLEQLKYRESTISLNQASILEILRTFYLHKVNNPGLNLYFRYVTNAGYNMERPAFFIDGRKGIDVWKDLANLSSLDGTNEDLKTIKRNLLKRINEYTFKVDQHDADDIESASWQKFAEYVEDDSCLIDFIKSFEWSSDNPNHEQVSDDIILALEQQYPGKPGKVIYERLFLYVFKLLCSPGLKRLEKCHLIEQCELPELGAADKKLLSLINHTLDEFHTKLKAIENTLTNQSRELNQLFQTVSNLKSDTIFLKSDTIFDLKLGNLPISPPNLIANGTSRTTKVNELLGFFEHHRWIAFQGIIGTGKSQLAALVSRQFTHSFWLDMREVNDDPTKAQLLLEAFLSHIARQPQMPDRTIWLKNVFESFPASSIVVLNDLPEISIDSSALQQLLAGIGSALEGTNVNLITTSNQRLPLSVYEILKDGLVKEYKELEFTDEEIAECLVNQGAPENFLKFVRLIAIKTRRNPRLTFSIIRHLRTLDWVQDRRQLHSVVFGQDFSSEVLIDVQRSISKYITDEKTKELLYRLSLIDWNFGFKEVEAISSVEKSIKFPGERLQQLINIWIQQLNNQKFQVSPIINNIGEMNLSDVTVKQVHEAFGNSLISNGKVNQMTAQRAIIAFTRAGKYNRAGHLLFNFYLSANTKEEIESLDNWGYLSFWYNTPLPIEMDLPLRALIKLQQLRLNRRLGRDTDALLTSVVEYLNSPDLPDMESVIIKMMLLVQHYNDLSLAAFWDYLNFVLQKWTWFCSKAPELVDLPSLSTLLWVPLNRLIEENDIRKWLLLANLMKKNIGEDAFSHAIASNVVSVLCAEITSSRNTELDDEVLLKSQRSRLQLLLDFFNQSGHELLEAIVFREIVNLQFNLSGDVEELKTAISEMLGRIENTVGKFILTAYLGRTLLLKNELKSAREWLVNALNYKCVEEINYTETLINTAAAFADTDLGKSVAYCNEAVQISFLRPIPVLYEYLQTMAEAGVAYWLLGDYNKAFNTYEIIVDRLYNKKREANDLEWIRIFSLSGHNTGFMASMLLTGKPPMKDGEDYFVPYIGMFFGNQKDFSSHYRSSNDPLIAAQMAFFADGLNMPQKAYKWSLRAFDLARVGNDSSLLMICSTCSQYAIVNFKPVEAFESNLLFAAVSSHLDTGTSENKYERLKDLDLGELLKVRPSEKWVTAESTTVLMTILPLFIQVISAELEGSIEKREWKEQFLNTIKNYIPDASDKLLWNLILEITTKILNNKISIKELVHRANTFNDQNRKELQILCILGVTFTTKDDAESIVSLINTIPYLQKAFGPIRSISKYVLVPFVKDRAIHAIMNTFVGTRSELQLLLDEMDQVDVSDEYALQKVLRPAVDLSEVNIPDDRRRWLFDFEEI